MIECCQYRLSMHQLKLVLLIKKILILHYSLQDNQICIQSDTFNYKTHLSFFKIEDIWFLNYSDLSANRLVLTKFFCFDVRHAFQGSC